MMSWFHQTVDLTPDAPVVVDLRAKAASAEQRLFKIAQQVGLPAHGLSGSYFEIAESISQILLQIEAGVFAIVPGAVAALYTPGTVTEALMRRSSPTGPSSPAATSRPARWHRATLRGDRPDDTPACAEPTQQRHRV